PKVVDPQRKPPVLRRFVRLAGLTWLEKLSSYLYGTSFLTLLAASMFDKVQVGFFSLAAEFTINVLSFVLSPTHGIVLPAFSVVFFHGTQEQRQDVFSASLRALGLLLWPCAALLVGLSPLVISGIYSHAYSASALYLRIFVLFYFVEYAVYSPANAALLAGDRLASYSRIKLLSIFVVPLFVLVASALTLPWLAVFYGALRLAIALALLGAAVRLHHLQI